MGKRILFLNDAEDTMKGGGWTVASDMVGVGGVEFSPVRDVESQQFDPPLSSSWAKWRFIRRCPHSSGTETSTEPTVSQTPAAITRVYFLGPFQMTEGRRMVQVKRV